MSSARPPRDPRWVLQWIPPAGLSVDARILGRSVSPLPGPIPEATPIPSTTGAGRLLLGVAPDGEGAPARLEQVHGCAVATVTAPGTSAATDAAVTLVPGLPLTIRTADCVPVLIASSTGVAVSHAGWRGSAEGITAKALARLAEVTGEAPDLFAAWIGPAVGPCCYEVGAEVAERFDPAFLSPRGGRRLDLARVNRSQLEAGGLRPERILDSGLCTRCHQHLFHSHRGSGGKRGRLDAIIRLLPAGAGPAPADRGAR